MSRSRPPAPPRGREIAGRYLVEGEIGAGGNGRVLRVRHRELDKFFALKLLGLSGGHAADSEARVRFYREARVAASLDHPHIVEVYDFGQDPERGLYLVMALLEGESAAERIERERFLQPIAACDLAAQAADALDYVHARGLVHGDVKPANLFLSPPPGQRPGDSRRSFVRLLDFGLSRPRASGAPQPRATYVEGTPAYLAPELVTGGEPDGAADLYSLGVTLYELLAGRPPFAGPAAEVMRQHLTDAPPPIRGLRGEEVPPSVERMVGWLMAKRAGERPSDPRAAAVELRACVASLGGRRRLSTRPPPPRSKMADVLVEQAEVAMFLASPTGLLLFGNPALERLLGVAGDEDNLLLGGTRLGEAFPRIERDVRAVLARRRSLRRRGVLGRAALQLTLSPYRRDGEVIGVCGVVDAVEDE